MQGSDAGPSIRLPLHCLSLLLESITQSIAQTDKGIGQSLSLFPLSSGVRKTKDRRGLESIDAVYSQNNNTDLGAGVCLDTRNGPFR